MIITKDIETKEIKFVKQLYTFNIIVQYSELYNNIDRRMFDIHCAIRKGLCRTSLCNISSVALEMSPCEKCLSLSCILTAFFLLFVMLTKKMKKILGFMEIYCSLPALWNVKSKDYSNKIKKNEQYDQLLGKYQKKLPEAETQNTINNLTSSASSITIKRSSISLNISISYEIKTATTVLENNIVLSRDVP